MIRRIKVSLYAKIAIAQNRVTNLNKIIYPHCNLQPEISTFNTL